MNTKKKTKKKTNRSIDEATAKAKKVEPIAPPEPDETWSLARRILWARGRVSKLGKDATVGYGRSQYKAITHDKVTAAIRPILNKAGILITMTLVNFENIDTGVVTANSGRKIMQFQAWYKIVVINAFDDADRIESAVVAFADDHGDKAPGKAGSYAMKNFLLKTFMVETGEDDEERQGNDADDSSRPQTIGDDEKMNADVFALADELYGEQAKPKLKAMAKRRFFVDEYTDIPCTRLHDVIRSLKSNHAREQREAEEAKQKAAEQPDTRTIQTESKANDTDGSNGPEPETQSE